MANFNNINEILWIDNQRQLVVLYCALKRVKWKGQMNQKIEIFFFVTLPSPNTKKNHPKWDLGKDFSPQAFIEWWKIKIRVFPKTSQKRFWNGRVIDWRLCDVNVGLSGRKNILRMLLHILYRLHLFVSFCEGSDWDWMKYTITSMTFLLLK